MQEATPEQIVAFFMRGEAMSSPLEAAYHEVALTNSRLRAALEMSELARDRALAEVERLNAAIAYVRQRSQRACEIFNEFDNAGAAQAKPQRDRTVARVDEHGVAYNAAGESIGMTGKTGHGCSGAVGESKP